MNRIKPRTLTGTFELLPNDQKAFRFLLDTIREVYESYGFLELQTPAFEHRDILLSKEGGETEKQIYFLQSTGAIEQGKEADAALRFDLTVPLARYAAQYERKLPFPFRRYQIQQVYRGERAQKGRFREFYQCDIDIIGKEHLSLLHDAEMPAIIYHIFTRLNLGPFQIHINNRKCLKGLFAHFNIEEKDQLTYLRAIDKEDYTAIPNELLKLLELKAAPSHVIKKLEALEINTPLFLEGLQELKMLAAFLKASNIPESHLIFNLAIARGLDYYTGTIYETFLTHHKAIGSICSGGRYDNLTQKFSKSKLPGVGISIGASRLFYQLKEAGLIRNLFEPRTHILIEAGTDLTQALEIQTHLQNANLIAELYLEKAKFKKILKYANDKNCSHFIFFDPEDENKAYLKNLENGEQTPLNLDFLIHSQSK